MVVWVVDTPLLIRVLRSSKVLVSHIHTQAHPYIAISWQLNFAMRTLHLPTRSILPVCAGGLRERLSSFENNLLAKCLSRVPADIPRDLSMNNPIHVSTLLVMGNASEGDKRTTDSENSH